MIRVLLALSGIAQAVGVVAIRHADQVHRSTDAGDRAVGSSKYDQLVHANLFALAALVALVLVGLTAVIVTGIHLREVGGTWHWAYLAGILLCLVAQCFAFVTRHPDVCLALVGVHAVAGLALSAALGPRPGAVVLPVSGEPVVPGPAGVAGGREPDPRAVDVGDQ